MGVCLQIKYVYEHSLSGCGYSYNYPTEPFSAQHQHTWIQWAMTLHLSSASLHYVLLENKWITVVHQGVQYGGPLVVQE